MTEEWKVCKEREQNLTKTLSLGGKTKMHWGQWPLIIEHVQLFDKSKKYWWREREYNHTWDK